MKKIETLMQISAKLIYFFRGSITAILNFNKNAFICQRGPIRIIRDNGRIFIGNKTTLWPDVKLSCVGRPDKLAHLVIGSNCSIGDRTEIHCGDSITIGNEVRIAWDCNILDRDYHAIDGELEKTKPVQIGNGAWLGCRSIILKGVSIGDGAVVAAGSVVTMSVPPFTVVAGNPAVIKRHLK